MPSFSPEQLAQLPKRGRFYAAAMLAFAQPLLDNIIYGQRLGD